MDGMRGRGVHAAALAGEDRKGTWEEGIGDGGVNVSVGVGVGVGDAGGGAGQWAGGKERVGHCVQGRDIRVSRRRRNCSLASRWVQRPANKRTTRSRKEARATRH